MAEFELDPYSEYLDLPPGERPPHFYDLLELEIFCAHPERIEHAVRKQFRKIKPYQEHPERLLREQIQDILTLIARAQVVLSDPQRKEEYDRELAERLGMDRESLLASRVAARVPEFCIRIIAGPSGVGEHVELLSDAPVSIGRDAHCVVTLDSPRVARLHAQLRYVDGRWWIISTEPKAVTLINHSPAPRDLLTPGDSIQIGGYLLRFERVGRSAPDEQRRKPARPTSGGPTLSLHVLKGPSIAESTYSALAPVDVLVGSGETALWRLPGQMVSRHHCRIEGHGRGWKIIDLYSTNGTFLNGRRITTHRRPELAGSPLDNGERLSIGHFEMAVRIR